MKYLKKIILCILILLNLFLFYKLNNSFNLKNIFKPSCLVETLSDIEYCYNNNPNVTLNIEKFYETGYQYIDSNYLFVDIDIDNKTLIGLVSKKDLKNKKITGYLEIPNNIIQKQVFEQIKKEYSSKFESEDIDEFFLPVILNSYNYVNNNIINLIYSIIFIITIALIFYVSIKIIKEEKYEK